MAQWTREFASLMINLMLVHHAIKESIKPPLKALCNEMHLRYEYEFYCVTVRPNTNLGILVSKYVNIVDRWGDDQPKTYQIKDVKKINCTGPTAINELIGFVNDN